MPLLDRVVLKVTDQMPSVVSPKVHAMVDLATAAAFFAFAISTWKRDGRAAASSAGCGLFQLVNAALTDYSARRQDRMDLESHARLDLGVAAMTGTMPTLMGIKDQQSVRFFRIQAIVIAAMAGLTDFEGTGENRQLRRIDKDLTRRKAA